MTQQIINVGAYPNDGAGDPIRTSFQKTNANFTELYTGAGVYYPQTTQEASVGVVPTNFNYPVGNVLRYGADPTHNQECTAAFQAAVNVCNLAQVPILVPSGYYYVKGPVIVSGSYFNIQGQDPQSTIIAGVPPASQVLPDLSNYFGSYVCHYNVPSTDLSYPTANYTGPMSGSAFYFTSLIYSSVFENIEFNGYKFALAFLETHAAPTFTNLFAGFVNALVFCYKGSQLYTYVNCSTRGGPVHISSATCFPDGSPYAGQDGYYTDGFSYTSTNSQSSAGGQDLTWADNTHFANPYFDTWFINSILRPTVPSTSAGTTDYVYPFDVSNVVCKPSGWAICYIPFRNPRDAYTYTIVNPNLAAAGTYGMGCVNTSIIGMVINGYQWEAVNVIFLQQHFIFGSINALYIQNVNTTTNVLAQVPFYTLTGQGYSSGRTAIDNTNTTFINCKITPPTYNGTTLPITTGFASNSNAVPGSVAGQVILLGQNTANSSTGYDSRADGDIVVTLGPQNGGLVSNDTTPVDAWNFSCTLPIKMPDGYFHRRLSMQGNGTLTSGILNVNVLNLATGETDYGQFYMQFGNNPFSLTTSAATNNGDQYIYVTSAPPITVSPFSQFTLNGTTVTINSYDSNNKRLVVQGVVSGLSATAASGSTISWTIFSKTLTPFSRNYLTLNQASASGYELISNISSYTQTMATTDQAVYLSCTFTNTKMPPSSKYSTTVPTGGPWAAGTIVYNSSPASNGYAGWICTATGGYPNNPGSPAVWQTFGAVGGSSGGSSTNLQAFTTPYNGSPSTIGIWNKPAGAKLVRIIAMGGGGGGGSGALCAVSGSCSGGAGGGGGAYYDATFDATQLPLTLNVYVGAGGLGGGFVSNSVGAGNPGLAGGETYVVDSTSLQWVYVWGGAGGAGGSADGSVVLGGGGAGIWGFGSGSTGGTYGGGNGIGDSTSTIVYPAIPFAGAGGLGTSSANGPPSHPAGSAMYGGGGGGAGGCIKAGAVTSAGNGGWAYGDNVGSSAGASGTPPGPGSTGYTFNYMGGSGGSGGGSTVGVTYSGAKGGDANGGVIGQNYGAGGGGGGAAIWRTVETSGKGGAGAPGFVLFITTF